MDYKKTNAPLTTVTRDMIAMAEQTGNVYETVCIIGKRANQIAVELKKELEKKLADFASTDNLEEERAFPGTPCAMASPLSGLRRARNCLSHCAPIIIWA